MPNPFHESGPSSDNTHKNQRKDGKHAQIIKEHHLWLVDLSTKEAQASRSWIGQAASYLGFTASPDSTPPQAKSAQDNSTTDPNSLRKDSSQSSSQPINVPRVRGNDRNNASNSLQFSDSSR